MLYFAAIERIRQYHYYIFLDDDVDLGFNSFSSQEMKRLTPFRAFEQWLLDDEPAVGVTNYRNDGRRFLEWRLLCGINDSSVVVPVMWFDALFNAFHHEAIKQILPYPTQYDKDSWWISQIHVMYSVELIFRGQALAYVAISAYNPQHRAYPRGKKMFSARAPAIIENIQNKAPTAYQNHTLFRTLKTSELLRYRMSTTTYCMNTTHRQPIVPYSHFEDQS